MFLRWFKEQALQLHCLESLSRKQCICRTLGSAEAALFSRRQSCKKHVLQCFSTGIGTGHPGFMCNENF